MGKINRSVFLISLVDLLAATVLVVLFARSVSKPILLLSAETDRSRNFQLDGDFQLQTHISEIRQLQGAIDRMKASLRSFTRFAPEQIVREVVVKGQEAMLGGDRREVTLYPLVSQATRRQGPHCGVVVPQGPGEQGRSPRLAQGDKATGQLAPHSHVGVTQKRLQRIHHARVA